MRALRFAFTRRPRPGITKMPDFLVSLIAVSASVSRNVAAVLLLVSSFSAMWRTSCVFVMPAAIRISSLNCERRGSNGASVHQLARLQADFMRVFSTKLWKTLWPSAFYRLRHPKPLWIVYLSNTKSRRQEAGGRRQELQ